MPAAKAAKAVEIDKQTPEPADPRAAALAALTGGTTEAVAESKAEIVVDDSNVEDFGGSRRALVLTSYYNGKPNGDFKQTRKGSVVGVTDYELKRGVEIGALRELGQ